MNSQQSKNIYKCYEQYYYLIHFIEIDHKNITNNKMSQYIVVAQFVWHIKNELKDRIDLIQEVLQAVYQKITKITFDKEQCTYFFHYYLKNMKEHQLIITSNYYDSFISQEQLLLELNKYNKVVKQHSQTQIEQTSHFKNQQQNLYRYSQRQMPEKKNQNYILRHPKYLRYKMKIEETELITYLIHESETSPSVSG
ncbi:hypothetical protein pb186bvf_018739 [Paramecium bursaria]